MKPDEFSPLEMYGNKSIFEKRLNEGYKEIALGGGEWIENPKGPEFDYRIVRLWVFFHPNGKIATYEYPKGRTPTGSSIRGPPFEATYSSEEFQKYAEKNQIKMGNKTSLKDIVEKWEE